ncbi:MAG: L-seryl-tRNA(Sec) selenium transferase [Chloroflexota bacterium]
MPESHPEAPGATGVAPRLRALPSVDRVLADPALDHVRSTLPTSLVTSSIREVLEAARRAIHAGARPTPTLPELAERAAASAVRASTSGLRHVINATGVIIHTNLGRAPLSLSTRQAVSDAASYSNLEYDLVAGERGSRYTHAVGILRRVTGCEDALVVNNNAAALVLVLSCFAQGREVILSRGQSVEIGGGFRIPEIMQTGGAHLVEVGTTNRTYTRDYAQAITANTSILMRVHASNFRIVGFTTEPATAELAELAHANDLLLVDDIGSGALLDTASYGLHPEPTAQDSLRAGVDIVLFSGDKLLGGPQCGIILGKATLVSLLRKHPLTRALRVDKMTLAALEATLLHYLKGEAEREIPVWQMLSMSEQAIEQRAEAWAAHLRAAGISCSLLSGESAIGGGSLPGETLPTHLLAVPLTEQLAGEKAALLRQQPTPVIARVGAGALLIDPRTVLVAEEQVLLDALIRVLG